MMMELMHTTPNNDGVDAYYTYTVDTICTMIHVLNTQALLASMQDAPHNNNNANSNNTLVMDTHTPTTQVIGTHPTTTAATAPTLRLRGLPLSCSPIAIDNKEEEEDDDGLYAMDGDDGSMCTMDGDENAKPGGDARNSNTAAGGWGEEGPAQVPKTEPPPVRRPRMVCCRCFCVWVLACGYLNVLLVAICVCLRVNF